MKHDLIVEKLSADIRRRITVIAIKQQALGLETVSSDCTDHLDRPRRKPRPIMIFSGRRASFKELVRAKN